MIFSIYGAEIIKITIKIFEWLKERHSQVLQQSLKDLESAYRNFFSKWAKSKTSL